MKVLWVKDNNIGHEKQVKILLDELNKNIDLDIDERDVKGFYPLFTYLEDIEEKKYDFIIGAGHRTYSLILSIKKSQKENTKSIAILSPTFHKDKFDIICSPSHDKDKFKKTNNVIFFEGSLAKVSDKDTDENTIMIAVGGKNKHFSFDENHIISQIDYFISIHPNKNCYIFNSRRTPSSTNQKLASLKNIYENVTFCDLNIGSNDFEKILEKASSKLITRDSVNMIFESLSCKGKTYLIDMKENRSSNKVVKIVDNLIKNKKVGFIDCDNIVDDMSKMKLQKQNIHNEIYAEVEKVSYKLQQLL